MKAMILAAGRGSRLRPITDRVPKPLVEIAGVPLIGHHLARLAAAGVHDIVINVAYRGEQIRAALGDGARYGVTIQYSEEVLGALDTGGGIAQATGLLGSADFLLINADVWTDFDITRLMAPPGSAADLTLTMIDNPAHHPQGDFALDANGRLAPSGTRLTYAGIARLSPSLVAGRAGQRFGLAEVIRQAIDAERAAGLYHAGRWLDVGRARTLAQARQIAG